jgi:ADP-heptose:LPS heptosyltransferase
MSKTIAIFRTGGIGDVILSTISINIIQEQLPGAAIIWFGRVPATSLIKDAFPTIQVCELASGNSYSENWSIIKNAAQKIDAVIDLQHSARTIMLGRFASFHFNCSYTSWNKYSIERSLLVLQSRIKGRKLRFDLFKKALPNRYEAMAKCTLRALEKTGTNPSNSKIYTPAFYAYHAKADKNKIAICLGAKFAAKSFPVAQIEKIIEQLISKKAATTIYLLGEENQKIHAEGLLQKFSADIQLLNLCGQTTLQEAAGILSRCKFSIANDSGLAHLSEAVNTPVLMFFGPTHQKFGYRPHMKNSRTLSVDLGCRPCNKNGDVVCRYNDHACSSLIDGKQLSTHLTAMIHD